MLNTPLQRRTILVCCVMALLLGLAACSSFAVDDVANSPKPQLKYRPLGKTGMKVTAVSMDCMHAPQEVISAAGELGINWFDTAWFFGRGRNEWAVGRALKNKRDSVFICTKIPLGTKGEMLQYLEMSLKRLQTDHVDMLMLHGAMSREQVLNPDALAALKEAKESGKTRFIGVSVHGPLAQGLDAAVEAGVYDAVQTIYFAGIDREVTDAVARAHQSGLPVIAMVVHTRKFENSPKGLTANQADIKWVLDDPNISMVVPETLSIEQLESNIAVMQTTVAVPRDAITLETK